MRTHSGIVLHRSSKGCSILSLLYVAIVASCFINYCVLLDNLMPAGKELPSMDMSYAADLWSSLSTFSSKDHDETRSRALQEHQQDVQLHQQLQQNSSSPPTPTMIPDSVHDSNIDHRVDDNGQRTNIDIISIGSVTRLGNMEAQRATWASHRSVRHFFAITEEMDVEADRHCHQELSIETVMNISDWCRDRYLYHMKPEPIYKSWLMNQWMENFGHRRWLSKKKNPVGWMCAQRRFAKGMATVMSRYQSAKEPLPDYLLLVDDDTYINITQLEQLELKHRIPDEEAYVAAGCRVTTQATPITNFAFGGFGQVYSSKSLERLTRSIHCNGIKNQQSSTIGEQDDFGEFQDKVCNRISESLIGEKPYFKNGMSLSDLILDARASADPYSDFPNWNNGGFCFHGDHYLANLVNLYGISPTLEAIQSSEMIIKKGSNITVVQGNNCQNEYDHCDAKKSMICHYQTPSQMVNLHKETTRSLADDESTQKEETAKKFDDSAPQTYDVHFMDTRQPRRQMKHDLSLYRRMCYEGVFHQLDDEWAVYIGGFHPNYSSTCDVIQIYNIFTKQWVRDRELKIPKGFPSTHHAVSYDQKSKFLYVVSGQMGGGCNIVSPKGFRVNVETKELELLPDLPEGRYAAGAAIVRPPSTIKNDLDYDKGVSSFTGVAHLHVFGGASPLRNLTAREHWRLVIPDRNETTKLAWEELEPIPDANSHAVTFEYNGYIYSGSALNNDFGMQPTESIDVCRRDNPLGVDSHHTTAMGAMYRYSTVSSDAPTNRQGHWERTQDMPFPAGQALVVKIKDTFLVVGGSNTHEENGSTGTVIPNTWVRAFHPDRQEWDVLSPLAQPTKFGGMAWYDSKEESVFVIRYNNNRARRPLWNEGKLFPASMGNVMSARRLHAKYLLDKQYRATAVKGFRRCIALRVNSADTVGFKNVSFMDENEYDDARSTWNLRKNHLQLPDLITYPETPAHASAIVQCAKRNGYKVCGRNGKHSFEGDTCAFGVVVDTTNLNEIKVLDYDEGIVRLGAGLRLGQVAVELEERQKLIFPMGHCASVGLTGLMLVGGQGVLSRHFGMTIDYIAAIELVDENGNLIRATENNNTDYLWLAKGGGSGVQHFPGIITSVETAGLPKPEPSPQNNTEDNGKREKVYTLFEIKYDANVSNAVRLMSAWQKFYQDPEHIQDPLFTRLTAEVWMKLIPHTGGTLEKRLYLAVYFYGNDELHERFMNKYYPILLSLLDGQGEVSKVTRLSSIVFHRRLAGVRTNKQLASGHDGWDLNKRWKGYSAVASKVVDDENALRILAESIYETEPFTERYVEMKPLEGGISVPSKESAAFWHRDAKWWLLSSHFMLPSDFGKPQTDITPSSNEGNNHQDTSVSRATQILQSSRAQHNRFVEAMSDSFSGYYAGYIDHGNSTGRDLELYYGDHAEKIASIKKLRDPHNVFHLYLPNAMDESWDYIQSSVTRS